MALYENNSISTHFALATLKAATRMGVDLGELLAEVELNPKLLTNPKFRLTPAQFGSLARLTWERGDDEFMGCTQRPAKYGTFSLYAREAIRASNLYEAYQHLCRFYRLVNDSIQLRIEISEETATLAMRQTKPELDSEYILRDFLLLLWHRFPSWLIGKQIPLFKVEMQGEMPEHAAEYRLMFPCPVSYGSEENRLIFDASVLQEPIIQDLGTLKEHLRNAPLQWFTRQEYVPIFTRRVRELIESPESNEADMESIANTLNITTRTLRRKLADEGTRFQDIKDSVRRDHAIHLLNQSALSIQSIASQLGYSETAAFIRAFTKWTGQTPKAFRTGAS